MDPGYWVPSIPGRRWVRDGQRTQAPDRAPGGARPIGGAARREILSYGSRILAAANSGKAVGLVFFDQGPDFGGGGGDLDVAGDLEA